MLLFTKQNTTFQAFNEEYSTRRSFPQSVIPGREIVRIALTKSNLQLAKQILQMQGQDLLDDRSGSGEALLHDAVLRGDHGMAKILLRLGADVNLLTAQQIGCRTCCRIKTKFRFAANGERVCEPCGEELICVTPLWIALYETNHVAIAKLLLRHEAQIELPIAEEKAKNLFNQACKMIQKEDLELETAIYGALPQMPRDLTRLIAQYHGHLDSNKQEEEEALEWHYKRSGTCCILI